MFDQLDSGFLVEKRPTHEVLDTLYTRVTQNELKKIFVDALALSLKLKPLADFYGELDSLKNQCVLKKPEEYPVPYPLTGFQSAVVFLCKNTKQKCPYLGGGKSINIVKPMPGVKPGSYPLCILMTQGLREFYKKNYEDIKESVKTKD